MKNNRPIDKDLEAKLQDFRKNLLDISNRNKLINFTHNNRSKRFIRFVDEVPSQIYDCIVNEEKGMKIKYLPDLEDPEDEQTVAFKNALDLEYQNAGISSAEELETEAEFQKKDRELRNIVREKLGMKPMPDLKDIKAVADFHGIDPSYELPVEGLGKKHSDSALQTLYSNQELNKRLSNVFCEAQTNENDKGISTLYLIFGFLEWAESEKSASKIASPLLLLPVSLIRKTTTTGMQYKINAAGRLVMNKCLNLKLIDEFKMKLPEIAFDENGLLTDSIEAYFQKVERSVKKNSQWKVRRFVSLTNLDFNKIVIYEDLAPERWKSSPLSTSPTIRHIFWGDDGRGGVSGNVRPSGEEYDIDGEAVANPENDILIKEADSSQHAAILDAMNGNNLVVSGPPGTGKSQTITNLIAQALCRGKKVLFMCEKLAALRVVKNRLDYCKIKGALGDGYEASLGDFCFELHSNSSKEEKLKMHSAMDMRLKIKNIPVDDEAYAQNVKNINKKRQALRAFSANLSKSIGNSGKNYYNAVWERERLQKNFDNPDDVRDIFWNRDAARYSAGDIKEITERIRLYARQYLQIQNMFPKISEHPWRWVSARNLGQISQKEIVAKLNKIMESVKGNIAVLSEIGAALRLAEPPSKKTFDDIRAAARVKMPEIDQKIIARFNSQEYLETISAEMDAYADFLAAVEKAKKYSDNAGELKAKIENRNIGEILKNIGDFSAPITNQSICDIKSDYKKSEQTLDILKSLSAISEQFPDVLPADGKDFSIIGLQNAIKTARQLKNFGEKYLDFIFSDFRDEAAKSAEWDAIYKSSVAMEKKLKAFIQHEDTLLNVRNLIWENDIIQAEADLNENLSFFKWTFGGKAKAAKKVMSAVSPRFKSLPKDEKLSLAKKISQLKRDIEEFKDSIYDLDIKFDELFATDGASELRGYNKVIKTVWKMPATSPNFSDAILKILGMPLQHFTNMAETLESPQTLEAINALSENASVNDDKNIPEMVKEFALKSEYLNSVISLASSIYLREDAPASKIYDLKKICSLANEKYSSLNNLLEFLELFKDQTKDIIGNIVICLNAINGMTADPELRERLLDRKFYGEFAQKLSDCAEKYENGAAETQVLIQELSDLAGGLPPLLKAAKRELRPEFFSYATIENIGGILSNSDFLGEFCDLNDIRDKIESQDKAWGLISDAQKKGVPPERYEDFFQIAYLYTLIDGADIGDVKKRVAIEHIQDEFKRLDAELYEENIQHIANGLLRVNLEEGVHTGSFKNYTEFSLVKHEAEKIKTHIPTREYMAKALNTVMELKPCFMMSPQTVSQYLPCKNDLFDLLIIDEASQMQPAEAIGAMARSKQVVIVGDKQQLPPTNFFSANISNSDDEIEDGESILDIADGKIIHKRMLLWHYRAKHESLINFSNKNFYGNRLVVFPSSDGRASNCGIKFHHIADGVYENGINEIEADALISKLPEIMKSRKDKSIGVVAVNQRQAALLNEKFEKLLSENREVAEYVQRWEGKLEEFFIKNLENVQGDERDIIIISFVYGETAEKKGVSGNFGPINKLNGYRRLNVLFSRAKEEIYAFSSMLYEQVKTNEDASPSNNGAAALKNYLYYAANGGVYDGETSHTRPVNDFEASVGAFLEKNGFNVRYQVGSIGYYIDIVIDSASGRHLLAIECDGAQYHSSKSARDRDKLRQKQLENLGWEIYRIWSTEWFNNRNIAEKRLLKKASEACASQ